jgi:NAD(P)-dependent dehydrogenase (short-subunit alcohol dehydrogenase family)
MDVKNCAAIVTGGASGLGEAAARLLAAEGAKVTLFDMNAERGAKVAAEIGGHFVSVNVADEASIDAGIASAREKHGQERIVLNCAGIASASKTVSRSKKDGSIRAHPMDLFQLVVNVNLVGSFMVASKCAEGMLHHDPIDADGQRGIIIHTASVAAEDGQVGQVAYAASKGGIVAMTLPMARDLAPEGIRVMTILPGFIDTPIYETLPDPVKDALRAHVQFPSRFGRPDEFADLVKVIITNDYLNGGKIRLDAGVRMPPR